MATAFVFKNTDSENRLIRRRILVTGIIIILALGSIIARVTHLQIARHDHFTTLSQDNRVKILPIPPTRGLIYSHDGVLLAENRPSYNLELIPEQIDDIDKLIGRLQTVINIELLDIERFHAAVKRTRRFEQIALRFNLSDDEVARFAVRRHEFPGVDVTARLKRHYPLRELTSHVIGYVGRIDDRDQLRIDLANYRGTSHIGKIGIERAYEDLLHGRVGYEQVEVNAQGRIVRVLDRTAPVPGRDVHLTLNAGLQQMATEVLGDYRGAIVALNPDNGDVLAMVSKPGYDPNLFVDGIRPDVYRALQESTAQPLFNRALQGQYPPGSTIKPFFGLAGLEYGLRKPEDKNWCPGWFSFPGHSHRYRDWKREGHGHLDMIAAIAQSCDVYFYKLADDMGIDRIGSFLSRFGFGQKTGIEIAPERSGNLPSREWKRSVYGQPWYPGETVIVGIGQGSLLTTPLQLARATAAMANGGLLVTPHLLKEAYDPISELIVDGFRGMPQSIALRQPAFWDTIQDSMREVMHGPRGTARRSAEGASYEIAGKTGTAQVIAIAQGEKYDADKIAEIHRDHALFIAYAPYDDPEIALAIIVENGGGGSSTAAPMARKIFDFMLNPQALAAADAEQG